MQVSIQAPLEIRIGDERSFKKVISSSVVEKFAEITEDNNPVHLDEEFAKKTFFKARIAHGFLVGSLISTVITQKLPGNGTIYISQSLIFKGPVFIGDEITAKVRVIDFPNSNRVLLKTTCENQQGKIVLEGEALVVPPRKTVLIINNHK